MQRIIDLARKGQKEEFKAAIKEQLDGRRDSFLKSATMAMLKSVGQKK